MKTANKKQLVNKPIFAFFLSFLLFGGAVNAMGPDTIPDKEPSDECLRKYGICESEAHEQRFRRQKVYDEIENICLNHAKTPEEEEKCRSDNRSNSASNAARLKRDLEKCRTDSAKCAGGEEESVLFPLDLDGAFSTIQMSGKQIADEEEENCDSLLRQCKFEATQEYLDRLIANEEWKQSCLEDRNNSVGSCNLLHRIEAQAAFKDLGDAKDACEEKYDCDDETQKKINTHHSNPPTAIYPNPSAGEFVIQLEDNTAQVAIIDNQGRIVERRSNFNNSLVLFQLDEPGIYVVNIISIHGEVSSKRIVVTE